jgi:hypothetical protein
MATTEKCSAVSMISKTYIQDQNDSLPHSYVSDVTRHLEQVKYCFHFVMTLHIR